MIQVFDSWAGHLSPRDYDEFALPYQKQVIAKIKEKHPEVPVIIYIKQVGALVMLGVGSGSRGRGRGRGRERRIPLRSDTLTQG